MATSPTSSDDRRRASRWERLSTGLKMWIILSLGLLPLGVIAIMASVDNARANRANAQQEAQALLAQHVQRFTLALSRNAFTIRAARDAIIEAGDTGGHLPAHARAGSARSPNVPGRFADLRQRARRRAASSAGFAPPAVPAARGADRPGHRSCRAAICSRSSSTIRPARIEGIAEYDRATLAARGQRAARCRAISRSSWSRGTG